jgi:hypothetical protein
MPALCTTCQEAARSVSGAVFRTPTRKTKTVTTAGKTAD